MTWKRKMVKGAAVVSLMAVDYCVFGGILPVEALFGNIFSSGPKKGGAEQVQEKLNSLMQAGKFDEALRFVSGLDLPYDINVKITGFIAFHKFLSEGDFYSARKAAEFLELTSDAKKELLREIEDMEWSHANRHNIQEWNETIGSHLEAGDVEGAIRFVKKCGMPWRKETEIIKRIRALQEERQQQQQQQQAQAEAWKQELIRLLQAGDFQQARIFIRSLPITEESKQALLAHLPPDPNPRSGGLGGFIRRMTGKK